MKDKSVKIKGKIEFISSSPHGEIDGIVLDDGSFVKVPPHSVLKQEKFEVGQSVTGTAELIGKIPNNVYHHAKLKISRFIVSNDSKDQKERDYEPDFHGINDAPSKKVIITGNVMAVGTKPKGEIDRIILADGSSVHLDPHASESFTDDLDLGDEVEIHGTQKSYDGDLRFIKAHKIIKQTV